MKSNFDYNYTHLSDKISKSLANPDDELLKAEADNARSILIEKYMPLAKHLATKYKKIEHEYALSAAYLGLCQAVRSWNPEKGPISSWIKLYCKNSLLKENDGNNMIKIPQAIAPKYKLIQYYKNQNYTVNQITKKINITEKQYNDISAIPSAHNFEDIEYHYNVPLTDEDILIDFTMLNEVEKDILLSIHGYDHVMTYKELAAKYNTSAGKIKFIEGIAMAKVRATSP